MSDTELANFFLELRRRGGPDLMGTVGPNIRRYALLLSCLGALIAIFTLLKVWPAALFFVGLLAGALLRDVGWIRSMKRTWPFHERITNWAFVEQLAKNESSDARQNGQAAGPD